MIIEIDPYSGFCTGVKKAIDRAEKELEKGETVYCLGDIVHNTQEILRLKSMGLITIDFKTFKELKNCKVLFRAHGEPPESYEIARKNNIRIIDATCSIVSNLQRKIKCSFDQISSDGQIVILGKEDHAEVVGLVGQTRGKAIVIEQLDDLKKIDYTKPVYLYAQTTKAKDHFLIMKEEIKNRIKQVKGDSEETLSSFETICFQVLNRETHLRNFAGQHDVILFISDPKSSNGKMLYEICKKINPWSFFLSSEKGLDLNWIKNVFSAGICGATSTPHWLMQKVKDKILTEFPICQD